MTKSIKVPREVQEVFNEAMACRKLSALSGGKFFPSLKELLYMHKAVKLENFAWRTLNTAIPSTIGKDMTYDPLTGTVTEKQEAVITPVKKPRKPRAPKAAPTTPTTGA